MTKVEVIHESRIRADGILRPSSRAAETGCDFWSDFASHWFLNMLVYEFHVSYL